MQALFFWDSNDLKDERLASQIISEGSENDEIRRDALGMASAAWDAREVADQWVQRLAPQWPPRRQPGVDRNILRLAVWELTSADTPPKVVIDEAIELAKQFSTEQSPSFVNALLDSILKEVNALKGQNPLQP